MSECVSGMTVTMDTISAVEMTNRFLEGLPLAVNTRTLLRFDVSLDATRLLRVIILHTFV